ncbi:hypothetical protein F4808DRAFT_77218 [Astrocystis sublimbata]|nr:hypothetical protein F4808DRAFT_77218 [Astrocystis sublimbata]
MATGDETPKRQMTPVPAPMIPQRRAAEDDHAPPRPSPLNPNPSSHDDQAYVARDKPARTKKETAKKRESKAGAAGPDSSRATPDPSLKTKDGNNNTTVSEASPLRYKLAPPRPADFDAARSPIFTPHHQVPGLDGAAIQFYETSEHVYNKKNYHYLHCIADPAFPSSFYYRQTEPEPHGPHMTFEDASTHVYFDQSGRHVTTDKGFRMARANVAVREGTWYWECKITRGIINSDTGAKNANRSKDAAHQPASHGHVRIGFARREASLDAPVGFDAYSYGFRDIDGQKVHMSRPKDFFPVGEDMLEGDVIGLEIRLPSEHLHRKIVQGQYNPAVDLNEEEAHNTVEEAANIVRDRIPIRFKAHIYFEKIDYHPTKELEDLMNPSPVGTAGHSRPGDKPNPNHASPALRTLPNSHIKVYKNGVLMGTAFTDLLAFLPPASKPQAQVGAREGKDDGMLGYYPAVSVFRGGAVETNFGPDFWYPPNGYETLQNQSQNQDQNQNEIHMQTQTTTDIEMADAVDDADTVLVNSSEAQAQGGAQGQAPRAISDRYTEQIVEDIVADIIDEVDFWMQDGARVLDRTGGRDEKAEPVGIAPASEEIKELVQDD